MSYQEKRIKPLKALALYYHINKCWDCREFFLIMDEALRVKTHNAPDGFSEAVIAKISLLPSCKPLEVKESVNSPRSWLHLMGCLYALLLSIGLIVFYNTELIQIPVYPFVDIGIWFETFFSNIAATIWASIGVFTYAMDIVEGFANHILVIFVTVGFVTFRVYCREELKYE